MQDRQLYERILGITDPWFVERVELKLEQGEVHVYLGHEEGTRWKCPECGTECGLYDHARGTGVAALGYLPVPNDFARAAAAQPL